MALIQRMNLVTKDNPRLHQKVSKACIYVFSYKGGKYVQIDTYGSDERKKQGAISQSIQLDEQSSRFLFDFLKTTYQFS